MNTIGEVINITELRRKSRNLNVNELFQLLTFDITIWFSWGSHSLTVDNKSNTRVFRFTVSGMLHKGHVYIVVNGMDLFDVYLTTNKGVIKDTIDSVYFDDLVDAIDRKVETK